MRAFMVATGPYEALARITAPAFQWATGIPITVVRDVEPLGLPDHEDSFAAKCRLPDDEQYVCVDSDLLFLREYQFPEVPLEAFAAVGARVFDRNLKAVLAKYGGDASLFVNTGLFVASAAHRDVMAQAVEWMRDGVSAIHEESTLNCALQAAGTPIVYLPARLNPQVGFSTRSIAHHQCHLFGVERKLADAQHVLDRFGSPSLKAAVRASRL